MSNYEKFNKGTQYRVNEEAAREYASSMGRWNKNPRLTGWNPIGPSSERGWSKNLPDGAVVTYEGTKYSGGCDGIDCEAFSWVTPEGVRVKGIFYPENWGCIPKGILTEVTV